MFPSKNELLPFDWTVNVYTEPQEIEVEQNCNTLLAMNISGVGGPLATINKFPINAALVAGANGEAFVIGGGVGEIINRQMVDLAFPNGGNCIVLVLQKFYIFDKTC